MRFNQVKAEFDRIHLKSFARVKSSRYEWIDHYGKRHIAANLPECLHWLDSFLLTIKSKILSPDTPDLTRLKLETAFNSYIESLKPVSRQNDRITTAIDRMNQLQKTAESYGFSITCYDDANGIPEPCWLTYSYPSSVSIAGFSDLEYHINYYRSIGYGKQQTVEDDSITLSELKSSGIRIEDSFPGLQIVDPYSTEGKKLIAELGY